MKRALVTGMAGAGKSSLLDELAARGYQTVDTDFGDYFQGTTRNQVLFYPRFHHIVLLSAPPEILAERLTTRTTNPYGKDPAELAQVLRYQQTVEPLLRAAATLEVVTTVPVARVADIVLDHVL